MSHRTLEMGISAVQRGSLPEGARLIRIAIKGGELSPQMREGIPEFLEAVIRRDTDSIIKALRKMGFLARTDAVDVSEKVIEFFHHELIESAASSTYSMADNAIHLLKEGVTNLEELMRTLPYATIYRMRTLVAA